MDNFHEYPLEVIRFPATRLRDLPENGYAQVLRCDDFATLRLQGSNGRAVQAIPGVVVPVNQGVWLETRPTGAAGGTDPGLRGILLLAWYPNRPAIVDFPSLGILTQRRLSIDGQSNAVATAIVPSLENGMHVITGICYSYTGAGAAAGLQSASIDEAIAGTSVTTLWENMIGDGKSAKEIFFTRPFFARPEHEVHGILSASGTAGVLGFISLYGGTIFV
jgi:hypothetical protein